MLRDGLSVAELARATGKPTYVARKRAWRGVSEQKLVAGFRVEKEGYARVFKKATGEPIPVSPDAKAQYGHSLATLLDFWAFAMRNDRREVWLACGLSMQQWLSGSREWTEDAGIASRVAALDSCIGDLPPYAEDAIWFEFGLCDIYRHDISPAVGLARALHLLALLAKLRVPGL